MLLGVDSKIEVKTSSMGCNGLYGVFHQVARTPTCRRCVISGGRAMYLEEKLKPINSEDLWDKIQDFGVVNPDGPLRPCVEADFWKTPAFARFDKSMIKKLRDREKAELMQLPKFEWDNIFFDEVASYTTHVHVVAIQRLRRLR